MFIKTVLVHFCLVSLSVLITGTGLQAGDTGIRLAGSEGGYHCKWSPDGERMVFASKRTGEAKMYIMPSEGGDPVLVKCGLSGDHHTGWSPDSRYLVFDSYGPAGPPPRLWLIPTAGGTPRPLVPEIAPVFQPAMSPDGEWVAFAALRSGNSDIWKAKLNGDSLTQITSGGATNHHPQWFPDGKSIVFASDRSGNWDIWMVSCDGSELFQITTAPELDDQPMVSPDGKLIAFMSERSGKRDIWLTPIDGGTAQRFTYDGENAWPSFSPNGKDLLWSSHRNGQTHMFRGMVADD
jgi:Tol biopolymer transport system component